MRGAIAPRKRVLIGECVGLGAAAACHVGTHGPHVIDDGMQRGVALADAAVEVGRRRPDRLGRIAAIGIDPDELGGLFLQLLGQRGAAGGVGGHRRGGKENGSQQGERGGETFHGNFLFEPALVCRRPPEA